MCQSANQLKFAGSKQYWSIFLSTLKDVSFAHFLLARKRITNMLFQYFKSNTVTEWKSFKKNIATKQIKNRIDCRNQTVERLLLNWIVNLWVQ